MKSLKKKIAGYIILISSVMSVVAVSVLFWVMYEFYHNRSSDDETVLLIDVLIVIVVVLSVETVLSVIVAFKASRSVINPINRIDFENPKLTVEYRELSPLAERIEAQNCQISRQVADLKAEHDKQDAMRRDFTANVSHEMKTPLTSISGYAELIKTGIAKKEDIGRFADKICDESQRLITLVGDIIKLSQLDGKDIPVEYSNIDLYETIEAVISQLELSAKDKNVTIGLQGEHIKLNTAGKIIEEMIFNICDNAVKYNRSGGSVTISLRQCIDGVEISVSDTGIGIPKEDIARIFERFFRVDKSHSKEIGGTGLGLSIVKHGAMFLGASVSVESELGIGTTVRIVL